MEVLYWLVPLCVVGTIVPVIVGFALLSVAVSVFRARRVHALTMGAMSSAMTSRWAHAAYSLWTGGEDCGQWPADQARDALRSWYGAEDTAAFRDVVADLRGGQTDNPAWDQVRALDLLRIGTAAGFVDEAECWARTADIADDLRGRYGSWEELGAAFEAGMLAWHDRRGVTDPVQRGRVQRNLPVLRGQIWPHVDWRTPIR